MILNTQQQKAVSQITGPLLILAGAGSGKTATLTARIEHMITHGVPPHEILAVTFTNKAAKEMKERIGRRLGVSYALSPYKNSALPFVGTFHQMGIFILKKHIHHLGRGDNFVIYDESDKLTILKNILKNTLNLSDKLHPPRQIATYISNAKNSLISAAWYAQEYHDSQMKKVVAQVYTHYEKNLNQNNALDFDDILTKTFEVLSLPSVLEYYQEKWKYIMVDEYQDTNIIQYKIISFLAEKYKNLAVVGDDWQSIYSWRGADMRNILNFQKDYPQALIIKLEQNYRSTKNIIDAANGLIKKNRSSLDKTLFTDNQTGEKITYIDAPSDQIEASTIAKIIASKGYNYFENLILYRTHAQSRALEEALMYAAIPYKVVWGVKFYERREIKDLLSYLKTIHNPNDAVALMRIINTPSRKIWLTTLEKLTQYQSAFGVTYLQIFEHIDEVDGLGSAAKTALKNFHFLLFTLIEASQKQTVFELISTIIKSIDYEAYLRSDATKEEFETRMENISELKNVASKYNGMDPRDSLANFLEEVSLVTDMDTLDESENNFVTLMTIHMAKWLEYQRVFIAGLEEGIFPWTRSMYEPPALEEERRLMYVAMTRAKQELYLSKAQERFQYGEYLHFPPSRFITEIDTQYIQNYEFPESMKYFFSGNTIPNHDRPIVKSVLPKIQNDTKDFSIGDRVSHPKFGFGLIISKNDDLAEIKFPSFGIKKMNIKIAPIKKV